MDQLCIRIPSRTDSFDGTLRSHNVECHVTKDMCYLIGGRASGEERQRSGPNRPLFGPAWNKISLASDQHLQKMVRSVASPPPTLT